MDFLILIKGFLFLHWLDIIAIVIVVGVLTTLWMKGYKKQVQTIILDLVVKAEQELGSGTGSIKYLRVTRLIYSKMPWIIKIFISDKEIDGWIENGVKHLKELLSDDVNLLSHAEEKIIEQSIRVNTKL